MQERKTNRILLYIACEQSQWTPTKKLVKQFKKERRITTSKVEIKQFQLEEWMNE